MSLTSWLTDYVHSDDHAGEWNLARRGSQFRIGRGENCGRCRKIRGGGSQGAARLATFVAANLGWAFFCDALHLNEEGAKEFFATARCIVRKCESAEFVWQLKALSQEIY